MGMSYTPRKLVIGATRLYGSCLFWTGSIIMIGSISVAVYAAVWLIADVSRSNFPIGNEASPDVVAYLSPLLGIVVGYALMRLGKSLWSWSDKQATVD